jgi:hypothetical protein
MLFTVFLVKKVRIDVSTEKIRIIKDLQKVWNRSFYPLDNEFSQGPFHPYDRFTPVPSVNDYFCKK